MYDIKGVRYMGLFDWKNEDKTDNKKPEETVESLKEELVSDIDNLKTELTTFNDANQLEEAIVKSKDLHKKVDELKDAALEDEKAKRLKREEAFRLAKIEEEKRLKLEKEEKEKKERENRASEEAEKIESMRKAKILAAAEKARKEEDARVIKEVAEKFGTGLADEEVVVEEKKKKFRYVVINTQGEIIKGLFDAVEKKDVEIYLNNEGYKIKSITLSKDIDLNIGSSKMSYSELSFVLTQLSTYIKAGISLIDAVRILEKQTTKATKRKVFSNIIYELIKGETFSAALQKQGDVFPKLLVNMVKTSEMTGDLPGVLDDMNDYYAALDKTKKQMVSAMMYPLIILGFSIVVISFVLIYVVPKFVDLFQQNNAELPTITKVIVNISKFMKDNYLIIAGILLGILLIYKLVIKNVKAFKRFMQAFSMRLPIVGNIIIYNEITMFTKTFASLLAHNVFITDSMAILNRVSDNEIYKEMIGECMDNLARGKKISDAFRGKWCFPVVAYEMLVTGENTGQLATMMSYVGNYYQELHANTTKRLTTFIEPIMIIFLSGSVGLIIMSIIIPMFDFYGQIGG